MKQSKSQSGFSIIEASLIILVVAILTVSGLAFYQRHKGTSTKSTSVTNQSQTTSQAQSKTTQATKSYTTAGIAGLNSIAVTAFKSSDTRAVSDAYISGSSQTTPQSLTINGYTALYGL